MTLLGAAEEAELKTETPLMMTTTTLKGTPGLSVAALEIVSVALFPKFTSNQSKVNTKIRKKNSRRFLIVDDNPCVCFSEAKSEEKIENFITLFRFVGVQLWSFTHRFELPNNFLRGTLS